MRSTQTDTLAKVDTVVLKSVSLGVAESIGAAKRVGWTAGREEARGSAIETRGQEVSGSFRKVWFSDLT